MVELVIITEKQKSYQVARLFLRKYRDNTRNISTMVNIQASYYCKVCLQRLQELQDIIQEIKSIPYVKDCRIRC